MVVEYIDDAAAPIEPDDVRAVRKRFSTVAAELALRGYELRKLDCGALLVTRWNLSRELRDIGAAESFAAEVGARRG